MNEHQNEIATIRLAHTMSLAQTIADLRAALAQAMADNEQLCAYLFFATGKRFETLPFYQLTHTGEQFRSLIEPA